MNTPATAAKPTTQEPNPATLERAFEALKTYDLGSGRAGVLPLDRAAAAAQLDDSRRKQLEHRFLTALEDSSSSVARQYVCSKLALIGSEAAAPALAALLGEGPLCLAARNALEAIPSEQAAKALRDSLPSLHGPAKAGVINSLGARRDHNSVRVLARLLKDTDSSVAGAAAAALGNIGSTKAGATLRAFQPRAPEAIRQQVADAVLTCAERLRAGGARSAARALYGLLAVPSQPAHIQTAANQGLRACRGKG